MQTSNFRWMYAIALRLIVPLDVLMKNAGYMGIKGGGTAAFASGLVNHLENLTQAKNLQPTSWNYSLEISLRRGQSPNGKVDGETPIFH